MVVPMVALQSVLNAFWRYSRNRSSFPQTIREHIISLQKQRRTVLRTTIAKNHSLALTSSHNIIKRWQHQRRQWFWLTKHKRLLLFLVNLLIFFVNSGKDSLFRIKIFSDWLKPSLHIVPEKLILSAIEDNWLRCLI